MASVSCKVELALNDVGFFDTTFFDPSFFDLGSLWHDVLLETDVRTASNVVVEYGIKGNSPADRVASTGSATFGLDNSQANSSGLIGYYSLLNTNKRSGFDLNIPVRVSFSSPDVASSTTYYKFYGSLDTAIPIPGRSLERVTHCVAVDLWDDYARIDEPDIALQTSKRADETLTTLLNALNVQPTTRSLETGSETYVYSVDGATGQKLKVRERIAQLTASEFGYCYTKGGTTSGGVFQFENRHHRVTDPTIQVTLNNTMDGLVVPGSRRDVFRTVQVFVHPTNDVGTASTIVLWSIQNSTTLIRASETNTFLFGAFFDPTTHNEIGGTSTIDPVATTDYTFNSASDGTGTDLTGNFTVTASRTGLGVRWTIVNNSTTTPAYITKLQVRGKPIYRFDAMLEVSIAGSYGDQVMKIDMPFQNSTNVGQDVATAMADRFSMPFAQVEWVRFNANKSTALMTAALQREIGDRIALTETVSGLSAHEFIINGCRLEYTPERQLWCTWYLEAASNAHYFLLGTTGFAELGTTTVLGF